MDPSRTQDLGVHPLRIRQIYTGPDLTTVYDYDFEVIIGIACTGTESDLILPTFSPGAEFELSDIVFDHEFVQVFAQEEPLCSSSTLVEQINCGDEGCQTLEWDHATQTLTVPNPTGNEDELVYFRYTIVHENEVVSVFQDYFAQARYCPMTGPFDTENPVFEYRT